MNSIVTVDVKTLLQKAKPHPIVQRRYKPNHTKKLVASFQECQEKGLPLILPMFFAVIDRNTDWLIYDGQHRLAALKQVEWDFADTEVCVSLLERDHCSTESLKFHFNKLNMGATLSVNLRASFTDTWEIIKRELVGYGWYDLIELEGTTQTTLWDAKTILKFFNKFGIEGLEFLNVVVDNICGEKLEKSKSFRQLAYFHPHFVNTIIMLPQFIALPHDELLEKLTTMIQETPITDWGMGSNITGLWNSSGKTHKDSRIKLLAYILDWWIGKDFGDEVYIHKSQQKVVNFMQHPDASNYVEQ